MALLKTFLYAALYLCFATICTGKLARMYQLCTWYSYDFTRFAHTKKKPQYVGEQIEYAIGATYT